MDLVDKFVMAYEVRDLSTISLKEIFQLVERKILRPETAERIVMEVQGGQNTND